MSTFNGFSSEEEFKNMANKVYYHNESDIISGALFGTNYGPENMTGLEITKSLVQMVQIDFARQVEYFFLSSMVEKDMLMTLASLESLES